MVIAQFSRKSVRESVEKMLQEQAAKCKIVEDDEVSQDSTGIVDNPPPDGSPAMGPVNMDGVKGVAAQTVQLLNQLVVQCGTVGMPSGDYEDMIADIQSTFGLPGQTADVSA